MTLSPLDAKRLTRRSVVGHFRVSQDVYDSLENEAMTQGTSLNALLGQVLSAHTRDDWVFKEVGCVKVTKNMFRVLLSLIPDERLNELGRLTAESGPDAMMLARKGAVNLDTVLDDLRFCSRSGWFSLSEAKENGKLSISLVHDFGPRESIFLGAYATNLFALIDVHPKITITGSSVMIEY